MANILIFTPRYTPQSGGSSVYFSSLASNLSDEHRFNVVTFLNPNEPLITRSGDVTVYRVIPRYKSLPGFLRLLIESIVSFLCSIWLFRETQVAHVHASSYATPGVTLAAILSRTPILYDCRDEMFSPRLVKLGRTPYWFSCAENVDNILIDNGVPADRIIRIPVVNPPYVEEEYSGTTQTIDETFNVIFIGRLIEEKGAHLLIEAFEDFAEKHPDTRLILVGDDPIGNVSTLIDESTLDEELIRTGEIEHREVIQKLDKSDILVLPSYDEALPRVIIEAFSVGVPVIATEVGSIPDIVDDGDNGILVGHSSDDIFDALETVYKSSGLLNEMSQSARASSQEWSWETVNERLDDTYETVAEN